MEPNQQIQQQVLVENEEHHYKTVLLSVLGLVVLALVVIFFVRSYDAGPTEENIFTSEGITIRTAPTVVETAPEGTLIAGFPEDLILADDAVLIESRLLDFFISSDNNLKSVTVKYTTKLDKDLVYAQYLEYLTEEGYLIEREYAVRENNVITARLNTFYLGLAITDDGVGGTMVSLIFSNSEIR